VTPAQRHAGKDVEILTARHRLYLKAKSENPLRWGGETSNWKPIKEAHLNPEKLEVEKAVGQAP